MSRPVVTFAILTFLIAACVPLDPTPTPAPTPTPCPNAEESAYLEEVSLVLLNVGASLTYGKSPEEIEPPLLDEAAVIRGLDPPESLADLHVEMKVLATVLESGRYDSFGGIAEGITLAVAAICPEWVPPYVTPKTRR